MKKYLVLLLVLTVFAGRNAMAQEPQKLHGEAKHHRSPDAHTGHKGKNHVATEDKKTTPEKPATVKPEKKEVAKKQPVVKHPVAKQHTAKPAAAPVPAKHVATKPADKPAKKHADKPVAKKPAAKHKPTAKPAIKHAKVTHHEVEPVRHEEKVTLNEKATSATVEIKNGEVFINNTFYFKIRSLKNEDDKITVDYVPPAPVVAPPVTKTDNNKEEEEEESENTGKAMLGVYSLDAEDGGAIIESVVPGSPADEAGLRRGDVITRLDEKEIDNSKDLVDAVHNGKPGERIMLTWWHCGKKEITCVVLDNIENRQHCDHTSLPQTPMFYKKFCHGKWR